MIVPTIHMNGTSRNSLVDQYCEVLSAVTAAIEKAQENGPNQRDYYPMGPDAWKTAILEHQDRLQRLQDLKDEYVALVEQIANQ